MLGTDDNIEDLARETIAKYGPRAAQVAAERINDMIDRNNIPGRDLWACVVHRIHERQGTGPVWPECYSDWRDRAPRLQPAY